MHLRTASTFSWDIAEQYRARACAGQVPRQPRRARPGGSNRKATVMRAFLLDPLHGRRQAPVELR